MEVSQTTPMLATALALLAIKPALHHQSMQA
jgi:hypothetical protein